MFLLQSTLLLGALGLLLSVSPITASPISSAVAPSSINLTPSDHDELLSLAARGEASRGPVPKTNSDVGFDMLYALLTKGLGAKLTQGTITKMLLNEPVIETPAMARYVVEARLAVERGDQKAAFQAMRKWSAEVDKELGLSK
ncbi:hypothetical protein HRG_005228 [Hirsutella rhossiliensis]|uniref:Uncharacterized protein n=1 Tax=Hirsutella rhossiliensis TaxID=111463 RepID=A0A9P8SH46_9HYPO|nr:uncharacterized protein HRG_05228 [Hirsutella rhossiliensis]KAH0962718.1 hypothetical protein HRG_05228 [Hirsutella rhossiliensis]